MANDTSKLDALLAELDAEWFGKSVWERMEEAVRAKKNKKWGSGYFYQWILETADEFLVEGQTSPQDKFRFVEITQAHDELKSAFPVLKKHIAENAEADRALIDVIWSSFLIGLACDREGLNKEEAKKYTTSEHTAKIRKKIKRISEHQQLYDRAVNCVIAERLRSNSNYIVPVTIKEVNEIYDDVDKYFRDHNLEMFMAGKEKKVTRYSIAQATARLLESKRNES